MSLRRATLLLLSLPLLGACPGSAHTADRNGRVVPLPMEPIRLPGLGYLALGQERQAALAALRARGFDCSEEAASGRSQACVRPAGKEEPTGGMVMLSFDGGALAGVQAQLQPEGDDSGRLARARFEAIEKDWTQLFGHAEEVKRPGVVATRRNLRNGTALLAIWYEGEPTLLVEHVQDQHDRVRLPPPPREAGAR